MSPRPVVLLLASLATSGCAFGALGLAAGAIQEASAEDHALRFEDHGAVRRFGCLDVALAVGGGHGLESLDVFLANRCSDPHPLDLAKLAIRGTDSTGQPRSVFLHDPRREVVPVHIAGEEQAHVRFVLDVENVQAGPPLRTLCFDLARVSAPGGNSEICFARDHGDWRPEG